ncbi:hypothetical protein ACQ4LE_009513 [Meloidogyne hapla]
MFDPENPYKKEVKRTFELIISGLVKLKGGELVILEDKLIYFDFSFQGIYKNLQGFTKSVYGAEIKKKFDFYNQWPAKINPEGAVELESSYQRKREILYSLYGDCLELIEKRCDPCFLYAWDAHGQGVLQVVEDILAFFDDPGNRRHFYQ